MSENSSVTIYSDGGAELNVSGGSACIIEDNKSKNRIRIAAFIGPATNNEAEIVASLLGFSFLQASKFKTHNVHWVCDSQYVLNSACQFIFNWQKNGWKTASKSPVKNQGLWRAYLRLSQGCKITPEHVRGHTGHEENEICDQAATWVRDKGPRLINGDDSRAAVMVSEVDNNPWLVINATSFLRQLRQDEPANVDIDAFVHLYKEGGWNSFKNDLTAGASDVRVCSKTPVLKLLEQAKDRAKSADKNLAKDIDALIKKYQNA